MTSALRSSAARKVFVANLFEQSPETAGYSFEDHLEALRVHDVAFDHVLYDPQALLQPERPSDLLSGYELMGRNGRVHDAQKLAQALGSLVSQWFVSAGGLKGMTVRVGINGFGRIGRGFLRASLGTDIEGVAVNDLTSTAVNAHLLKYDSTQGTLALEVSSTDTTLRVGDSTIAVLAEKDPAALTWSQYGVDVVIESTGRFTDRESPPDTWSVGLARSSCRHRAPT
jgi:hypothetical protein